MTVPSADIFSPGRTTKSSPTRSWSAGTLSSRPSLSTVACFAPRSSSARSAAPALRFARASRYRPSRISAVTPDATSR